MACKDCATGSLHTGTVKGRVETLYDLPCYVTEPPGGEEAKATIVLITDAFGWELPNSRLLADNYAHKGKFRVLVPDFMDGHWMRHDLMNNFHNLDDARASYFSKFTSILGLVQNFAPFLYFTRLGVCKPRVESFFRSLRAASSLPVGCAGFCWGGKHVALLCSGDAKTADGTKHLVDCGFTAHPSFIALPDDMEAVTIPLSIANGTKDMAFKPDHMQTTKAIWEKKRNNGDVDCELVVYEGAKHGFAMRGNPDDAEEKRMGVEAEEQALRWFAKHLTYGSKS